MELTHVGDRFHLSLFSLAPGTQLLEERRGPRLCAGHGGPHGNQGTHDHCPTGGHSLVVNMDGKPCLQTTNNSPILSFNIY